ncbi:hypothetical protein GCM10009759_55360 [Kitasatospora saccharophila]|uniref:Uncharacterized protein n=1 Tax=Kitasatospora saccharophila TaxID=407973 RepID=A0ABP5J5J7_9ACTN
MSAPEQQAAPEQPDLRQRLVDALRDAAYDCDGHCGLDEQDCLAQHPIEVAVEHHGVATDVYGPITALAEVAADAVQPELAALREQAERYQLGALERAALLEEARDELEAAGQNGAHGDAWPAIAPAIRALAAENTRLRALLARDHAAAYHQGEPRDSLLWHCGRDHCTVAPAARPTT